MGNKKRRNITIDPEINEAVNQHPDDLSPFVNKAARKKYVEGGGGILEDILIDEFNSKATEYIEDIEPTELRNHAQEMREHADKLDEIADDIETKLNELDDLTDDITGSAEKTVQDRKDDITASAALDETTWDEAVDTLSGYSYQQLSWHRDDGATPRRRRGQRPEVNAALKKYADELGIHHDELLTKLVEEGHVEREQNHGLRTASKSQRDEESLREKLRSVTIEPP